MKYKKQSKLPLIGITGTLLTIDNGSFKGRERIAANRDYIRAIELSGGVPFVLPVITQQELLERQIQALDGLLLSGGYDVVPLFYNEEPQPGLQGMCSQRDVYELNLVQIAYTLKKPIFGICRGLQLLNVAFGGTLYQDISLSLPSSLQHQSDANACDATHTVDLVEDKELHRIFNEKTLITNSFHHQAIHKLAPNLRVNAVAKDGIIEGVEGAEDSFILGVQWHPESMLNMHPHMLKLFQTFTKAASERGCCED